MNTNRDIFWRRDDLVDQYNLTVDLDSVNRIRAERGKWIERDHWAPVVEGLAELRQRLPESPNWSCNLQSDQVQITTDSPVDKHLSALLETLVGALHPWRKGPFRLLDREVDAEWRSNLKWDRIRDAVGDLHEHRVLDVGCGNGYYMFRMAAMNPRLVLGIDPAVAFLFQFELFQHFLRLPNLQYELLGVEELPLFQKTFDTVFCMGILYHHRNPIGILRDLRSTLRLGGRCLVECQTIAGTESIALFPEDRYAKARNVFFVPTASCLINWMKRSGFRDVELVSHEPVTVDEQRRTADMRFESLADFLDPEDESRTIEGYPGPWRTAVMGTRADA